tara:strand:- start:1432 stop:1887 length:456 start_codon:yes stop_codon:yes gene_type:complete
MSTEDNEIKNYILEHMEYVDVTLRVRADDAKLLCRSRLAMIVNNYEKEHSMYAVKINNLLTEGKTKQIKKNIVEYIGFIDEYRQALVELSEAVTLFVEREADSVAAHFPIGEKIDMEDFNAKLAEASEEQAAELAEENAKIKKVKRKSKKK